MVISPVRSFQYLQCATFIQQWIAADCFADNPLWSRYAQGRYHFLQGAVPLPDLAVTKVMPLVNNTGYPIFCWQALFFRKDVTAHMAVSHLMGLQLPDSWWWKEGLGLSA